MAAVPFFPWRSVALFWIGEQNDQDSTSSWYYNITVEKIGRDPFNMGCEFMGDHLIRPILAWGEKA